MINRHFILPRKPKKLKKKLNRHIVDSNNQPRIFVNDKILIELITNSNK